MNNNIYSDTLTEYGTDTIESGYVGQSPVLVPLWQFIWFCMLILSFCYELPLVELTGMDRLNPRLFDVVFVIGMLTVFFGVNRENPLSRIFTIWAKLISIFCICAVVWMIWIPLEYSVFSIFFALKYLEGLLMIYLAARMRFTSRQKKILHNLIIVGGIVVAIYAIPEHLRGATSRVLVEKSDKMVAFRAGEFFSCLGAAYFHVSMFSSLASIMSFALFLSARSFIGKSLCFALGIFVAWPAFFSGARTGVVASCIGWLALFILARGSFKYTVIIMIIAGLFVAGVYAPKLLNWEYLKEKSPTLQRFEESEQKEGSDIKTRLDLGLYNYSLYRWQGFKIPFIGAGFYVAPHTYPDGNREYRVGYGIHNIYIFAFEQGGILGFILFIVFLVVVRKQLKQVRQSSSNKVDYAFATGMYAFYMSLLVVGLPGQVFWQGFNTENFNTYILILFVLAGTESVTNATGSDIYMNQEYISQIRRDKL